MTINREELYLNCINKIKQSPKWDSVDFSQKLRIIKALSQIYTKIPEDKIQLFNSELILAEIADRGDRTRSINKLTKRLVDFNKSLDNEIIFSDKNKVKEMIFGNITGIDLD